MKKRVLSLFLALTLCLTLLPTAAFAEGKTGGEDGTSDGSEPQYVAQIGETKYETMQDALDEMSENEITLLDNVSEEELTVYAATTIHMDGHSITGDIVATDSLTLKNGTVNGTIKVDGGTFNMTAPETAEAAITKGLNVISGSAYVSGAKIGVKGILVFGGTDMVITGTDKAVELTAAAEPSGKKFHGSTNVDGGTAEEATFDGSTYQVSGGVAKKLSYNSVTPEPSDPTLTLSPTEKTINAGETATFTATYTGTGTLNAYIQKNGLDTNFVVSTPTNNGDGTYTITVAISEDTPTGDYTLYVHETKDTSVQAMAKIHVKGKDPVAEVIRPGAMEGTKYFSLPAALNAAQNGDTVTLLSDVDLGETYVTISKNITFDLGGKTLSSSKTWSSDGVLLVKDATVTVKNGKVKATGSGNCAIHAYRSGARMTLEDVTATVTSDKSSVMVGDFGSAVIKSGDYQGLYVGAKSQVTLEGGTFRPYMDNITNKNVKSIFWKVNETTDDTSRDCMELLGDGCVYVDETRTQVRTGGGFNTVVTVQQGTAIDAPVAKIGDVEYASLSKAINAVQNGGTITLLGDLNLGNGAVLQVGSSKKNFTIDLDSHTLSADGACLIMLHNGSQLTLKNGTLDGSSCTSYNGVLYISSNSGPKLTLESVTAKSGSVADLLNVQRSVPLVYVTNGTVVFDGGTYTGGVLLETDGNAVLKSGTFQKGTNDYSIKTKDSGKHLSDYLDDDSQFWDDNTPLDLSNETQIADEVTVRPCKHNWKNGKCTVCQKVCDHGSADGKSMTAAVCPACGMKAAAQVDITGSDAKYFLTFSNALSYATRNDGCTLKLLANVVDVTVTTEKPFIFDLNGCTIHSLTVNSKITLKDSSGGSGQIVENLIVEVKGMSVGELLEEGYAFRSCLDGSWPVATVQTVGNVSILPAPIKSVTAENPSVTVEYGKTVEVTLKATVVPSAEEDTGVSCQWRTGGGTMPKIEGATGSTYQLPADLSAGEHTFYLIATKDGYEKSCEFTVTVKKADLRNAEIAFPYGNVLPVNPVGATGVPTFTVTCNGKEVEKDALIITGDKFDDVGTYTLTVTAAENSNYTGSKSAEWTVRPLKIKLSSRTIEKTYDGTTDLPANAKITFESAENMYAGQTIGLGKGTDYQLLDTSYDSPDAGEEKTVSGIVKLLCKDFVFDDGTEAGTSEKGFTLTGKINKAAAPSMSTLWQELHVFNDLEKTYEIELETLLPKRTQPCEYGTVTYGALSVTFTDTAYKGGDATLTNGVLRLPIKAASSAKSEIGTLTVEVSSTNYQTFTLTLHIIADDKIVLNQEDVTVSATDITYGQTLNDSTLTTTGSMICPRTKAKIPGTFAWTDGTIKPNAGSYEAEWTFTPDASNGGIYANATGKVSVKVNPKDIKGATVTLKSDSFEYDGTRKDPKVASVVLDGETLVYGQYNDYGYHYDMASDVGTYNLVVGGNHNYTGSVSVTWSITPKTVTPTIEVASCSYTGDTLTPDVTLTDDIGNTIDPKEYTVSYSNNTNAGTGTVTIKDTAGGNYVLNEASTTFTITKAAAPTLEDIVISHKYTVTTGEKTIGSTMPVDAGALSFTKGTESTTGFVTVSSWAVDAATGKVTYTLSSGTAGDTVTLPVTISSTNYADTVINVVITLTRRDDQAALVITGADAVIYGEKLTLTTTGGSGTGTVTYRVDTDHSIGEATIDPNTGVLTPVKVGSVSVIAAKAGDNDYNDITSAPFVLMIKPATPSGEPNYTKITTSGKTLADAQLTVGTITPAGTISWDAGDTQSVAANTAYNWTFKPTDTVNYNNLTGSITPYTVSHSGGGGGSSHSSRYAITVDKTENGTITVSPKSASKGDTVTITVKPDKGYELDTLKVLDKDGDRVKLTEKNGKYTFVMPASKVIVKGSFAAEAPEQIFFDVPVNAYYYNAVKWAADKGITGGVSPTLFAPDQPCTRAQIVTFLWRAAGSPAPKSTAMAFTDVPAGSYYYDAVLWAIENGVTKGTSDTTFSPNANCSRGQIVTFLWRSQKSPDAAAANPFTDVAADAYYISAVLWAVERNITGGTSATTFSPSANCTRAQIVTFIYRYMK